MSGPALAVAVLLAPMVLVAAANLAFAPRLHRLPTRVTGPLLSVLVPARDEAANLGRLLPALLASRYGAMEVLVLDDGSRDGTTRVARGFTSDPRLRVLQGRRRPPGWTGKNWACHQLADAARGDLLLFCDADVRPGPAAVARTVTALDRAGVDAVTAIPRHERGGWFEQAVIPLVTTVPIVALLPLPLVRWSRAASLSVGNGQWFAWRRRAYERLGGHARVRGEILEDVRLARLAKAEGLRVAPLIASRDLAVRMYRDRATTWQGFAKNLYLLAGGRTWTLAVGLAVLLLAGLGPFAVVAPAGPGSLVPLAELLAVRVMAAALVADPFRSVALHPVGVLAVAALALSSRRGHRLGTLAWKGRTLDLEEPI